MAVVGSPVVFPPGRRLPTPEYFCFGLMAPPPELLFATKDPSQRQRCLPPDILPSLALEIRGSFWIMRTFTVLVCASAVDLMPLCGDVTLVGKAAGV